MDLSKQTRTSIMACEINQNILMMGFLLDRFFGIQPTPELEAALKEDMLSMFSGTKADETAQIYFGKLKTFKANVTELMIVQDCLAGKGVASISSEFGMSSQSVYRVLKKHKCKPKKVTRLVHGFAFYHRTVEHELIRLMHADGVSIKDIALNKNIRETTVKEILRVK
ncbi:hypothetical protein QF117_18095 [Vibrio sp. YMD68]|uniref:hypothetical protein n=1 Tax=Vibrio sp. YMD68 TaxID=3042300 RepID=UPI00249AECD7|nr:hypothetical protein [Vibrio sp. YMD68]WGV99812.1 hypothetical protein QF117_18095 [Vibrio sp. YMD68]